MLRMTCCCERTRKKYHELMAELRKLNNSYQGNVSHWHSLLAAKVIVLEELLDIPIDENNNRYNAGEKDPLYGYEPPQ